MINQIPTIIKDLNSFSKMVNTKKNTG